MKSKIHRRCLGLLLVGIGLLAVVGLVPADEQDHRSHIPLPGNNDPAALKRLFEERLRQVDARAKQVGEDLESLGKVAKELLKDPELVKELVKQFKDKIDPKDRQTVEKLKQAMDPAKAAEIARDLSPQEIERLRKLAESMFPGKQFPSDKNTSPSTPDKGPKSGPNSTPPATPDKTLPQVPGKEDPKTPMPRDPEEEALRAETTQQLLKFFQRLERMSSPLNESPAFQQFIRDLSRQAMDLNRAGATGEGSMDLQLAKLTRGLTEGKAWLEPALKSLGKLEWPELPKMNLPAVNFSTPSLPSVSAPSVPQPRVGMLQYGLLLAALIGLGLLVWKLLTWLPQARAKRGRPVWKLGPWPLHPAAVASRQDLVRTFEYLSLLRLGQRAQSWNHREIAVRLGTEADERRDAAARLATCYEQARYAPTDDTMPDEALAAARRDLCFLAGVAA